MRLRSVFCAGLLLPAVALAQDAGPNLVTRSPKTEAVQATEVAQSTAPATRKVIVPAGTKILMVLKGGINTKTAQVGNGVYMETAFPIAIDNKIVIPPGTYVQGTIDKITRPGRVKGRAELQFHFTTLIFPNGFTAAIPGALEDVPGAEKGRIKDKEGTVQADATKGKDAGTIASTATTGTLIGSIAGGGKGAGIGAIGGGLAGLAQVLLSRGDDVVFPTGTSVEMVLQRNLELEERVAQTAHTEFVPTTPDRRLGKQPITPAPEPR